MNICLCGTQAGYPHLAWCPYPYYGNSERLIEKWEAEYAKRKPQPCGHPVTAIVSTDEGTHHCGECAKAAEFRREEEK